VTFDPATKAILAAVPDDEPALRHRLGIAANEKVGDNYQEAMNLPTLNVSAMKAGEPESHRSVIPASATAWFDLRTVPATPSPRELALVRAWVEGKGYHLVQDKPSEEERARYPHLASITGGGGMEALMTPLDAPVGRWAAGALRRQGGQNPVRIPIMGGGVPTAPFSHTLGVPVVLLPLVNADDNQHAANENLRMGNYFYGVDALSHLSSSPMGDDAMDPVSGLSRRSFTTAALAGSAATMAGALPGAAQTTTPAPPEPTRLVSKGKR
jgi:acetylornithine deacetylase/succinyl-diaminopimelate desuccinylase-like protein